MDALKRQKDVILQYMRENGSITTMQAYGEGITRLSARIYDLRRDGHDIRSITRTAKNRYGKTVKFDEFYIFEEDNTNGTH